MEPNWTTGEKEGKVFYNHYVDFFSSGAERSDHIHQWGNTRDVWVKSH
jgi:hypothetical protein